MRVDLIVPFAEKDRAKALGARWDYAKKCWYVVDSDRLESFLRWMPVKIEPGYAAFLNGESRKRKKRKSPKPKPVLMGITLATNPMPTGDSDPNSPPWD